MSLCMVFFLFMLRRPPIMTMTYMLFPYPRLIRLQRSFEQKRRRVRRRRAGRDQVAFGPFRARADVNPGGDRRRDEPGDDIDARLVLPRRQIGPRRLPVRAPQRIDNQDELRVEAPVAAVPQRRRRAARRIEVAGLDRSEEHTSELQSLMRISYAVFCLKKKKNT